MSLVIYCVVFLIIGFGSNSKMTELIDLKFNFNSFERNFYQSCLSLFYNVKIDYYMYSNLNKEIWTKAPVIIHNRFCNELVEVMKQEENKGKATIEVSRVVKILDAIEILMDFYPELKPKS
jgi:hypothetical protein